MVTISSALISLKSKASKLSTRHVRDRLGDCNPSPPDVELDQTLGCGFFVLRIYHLNLGIVQRQSVLWLGPKSFGRAQKAVSCDSDALGMAVLGPLFPVRRGGHSPGQSFVCISA